MLGKKDEKGTEGTVRTIASPKATSKLSPIQKFKDQHDMPLNVNPKSQQTLLKYAEKTAAKGKAEEKKKNEMGDDSSENEDFSKFQSRK